MPGREWRSPQPAPGAVSAAFQSFRCADQAPVGCSRGGAAAARSMGVPESRTVRGECIRGCQRAWSAKPVPLRVLAPFESTAAVLRPQARWQAETGQAGVHCGAGSPRRLLRPGEGRCLCGRGSLIYCSTERSRRAWRGTASSPCPWPEGLRGGMLAGCEHVLPISFCLRMAKPIDGVMLPGLHYSCPGATAMGRGLPQTVAGMRDLEARRQEEVLPRYGTVLPCPVGRREERPCNPSGLASLAVA